MKEKAASSQEEAASGKGIKGILQGESHISHEKKEIIAIGNTQCSVYASSTFRDRKDPDRYSVKNAFDGDPSTAWVEGAKGDGTGEYIVVEFPHERELDGFFLYPGYMKSPKGFTENSVPREIELQIDDLPPKNYLVTYDLKLVLPEEIEKKKQPREMDCYHTDRQANFSPRLVIFHQPMKAKTMKLMVKTALSGSKYQDMAISEWQFLFTGSENGNQFMNKASMSKTSMDKTSKASMNQASMNKVSMNKKVVSVVRSLREKEIHIPAKAFVEDLREKFIVLDYRKGSYLIQYGKPKEEIPKTPTSPVFIPRLEKEQVATGNSVFDKFLKYTLNALLDSPVAVVSEKNLTYVIGTMSGTYRNGEWVEFYPAIVLDKNFEVTTLKELTYIDGDPGCHDVIPAIQ
jgi:hypothetical protein